MWFEPFEVMYHSLQIEVTLRNRWTRDPTCHIQIPAEPSQCHWDREASNMAYTLPVVFALASVAAKGFSLHDYQPCKCFFYNHIPSVCVQCYCVLVRTYVVILSEVRVDEGAPKRGSLRVPSVLPIYTTFHHCSFSIYHSPRSYTNRRA